jgi:hypothetical protein
MSLSKRPFRVQLDKFHHRYSTKFGQLYAPFLLRQVNVEVEGAVKNMPTVLLHPNPFDSDPAQLYKKIVDCLYQLNTKAEGETAFQLTAFQAEHQHRNQALLHYRMFDYYNTLTQEHKDLVIEQVLVYTGDEEFNSPTELDSRKNKYSYPVVDLSRINPTTVRDDPHFAIQFLSIFNRQIPKQEKVRIIFDGLKAYRQQFGPAEAQFLVNLIPLMMANYNASDIDAITTELLTDEEFYEMVKMSQFYTKLQEDSKEEGKEEGRLNTALEIIRSGAISLDALTNMLRLTPAEIAAIQAMLQQSSNGNGSKGEH